MDRLVRAALAPVALGVARARRAPARWALPALGVALATALLGTAAGGGAVAGEQAAHDVVAGLTPAGRSIRLTWSGGLPEGTAARARRLLRDLTAAPQARSVLLLATGTAVGDARRDVQLAAIAPLRRWVALRSGRLPQRCDPKRCEVLAAGGGSVPTVVERNGTRLVTVGRATLTSAVPLGFVPSPQGAGQARADPHKPLLLAADPAAVDALPGFASVFRTQGWTAPLLTGSRTSWELPGLGRRFAAVRAQLEGATDEFALTAPEGALELARARAREARHRVLLVGAGAAALLAAFVVLAAAAMRRDLDMERGRLERRGARRWQIGLLAVTEATAPAVAGVVAGGALALAVTAWRAHAADVGVGAVVGHTLFTTDALLAGLGLAALSSAVLVLVTRPWGPAIGRLADVAAVSAAGALALALSRGGSGDAPGDPLPALLPPLACLVAAVVVARLAVPVLRGAEAAVRRGPVVARLAALGIARAPGGPALTIAVVAVGCGLSCFAWAYRATLRTGDVDQAAYAVPLDVTVREGPSFVGPLTVAPEARWHALAGGGPVLAVYRQSVTVPRGASAVELPLLAIPAAGLADIRRWRDADASAGRPTLARRLRLSRQLTPRGAVVGPGDRRIDVRASAAGDALELTALLQQPDGSVQEVALGSAQKRARRIGTALPRAGVARRLIGVQVALQPGLVATNRHREAEADTAPSIEHGTLTLRSLRIGGRSVGVHDWVARGPLRRPRAIGDAIAVAYAFDRRGRALLTPRQPGEGRALPVLADPATAASAGPKGLLPVTLLGERLRARVVGTVARFPTVAANAAGVVVADRASLAAVLQAQSPGTAAANELWIGVAAGGPERRVLSALRAPGPRALEASSRRATERALRSDPLARELVRTLVAAAIVALALAALGVLVAVALALRDDAAELFDLEALGVPPRLLRRDVRLRAAALAILGLAAGLGLGAALVSLAVDAVRVTAAGAQAVPPLVAVKPWATWGVVALAFGLAVAAGTAVLTRRALAGPVPRRTPEATP